MTKEKRSGPSVEKAHSQYTLRNMHDKHVGFYLRLVRSIVVIKLEFHDLYYTFERNVS